MLHFISKQAVFHYSVTQVQNYGWMPNPIAIAMDIYSKAIAFPTAPDNMQTHYLETFVAARAPTIPLAQ
jgi:hypothetical protein